MKRLGVLLLALSVFVVGWMSASVAGSRLIGGTGERQVFVSKGGSSFSCGGIDCVGSISVLGPFNFSDLGNYDVTISLSFQYRTSPGDGGLVWIATNWKQGPEPPLAPGKMWLAPSALGTSTSVTWIARGLDAGVDYRFSFDLTGGRGSHGGFRISTSSVVAVIEATSSD
jgi:hypothetical protein